MNDSIKKRYSYKLFTNMVGAIMALITLTFVPRSLGVEDFGRFEFITANILSFLGILTPGFEMAYFSWVSRKGHKENTDVATGIGLYWGLANVLFVAFFIWLFVKINFNRTVWPDVPVWVLWLGLCLASLTFFSQLLSYLADGKAYTVGLEKIRLGQNIFRMIGLLFLFLIGELSLSSYFLLQILLIAIIVMCLFFWLKRKYAFTLECFNVKSFDIVKVREFISFCVNYAKPFILLSVVSFGMGFFDRWFLQLIGGASQQGFYSLSLKLGAMAMLFTSSMTPIIMREFGHAYENNDFPMMRKLFNKIEIFIFIATTVSIFLFSQSSNMVQIFGGEKYSMAIMATSIMFLSPIHQTLGQLSTSLMNVTGQTMLYSKITIFQILISFPITYMLIAPARYVVPGLELGSTGLALKLVLVQILITNVFLFYNARFLKFSFNHWILIQLRILSTVCVIVYIACFISSAVFSNINILWHLSSLLNVSDKVITSILQLALDGFVYTLLLVVLVYFKPSIAGLSHAHIVDLSRKMRQLI